MADNEKGLAKVGYLENVKLGTAAGFCFVVDVYITNAWLYSSSLN